MDIAKMLDYQKVDAELFKLEKALRDNPNKKIISDMTNSAKSAQAHSSDLESKAGELINEIETVKKQFAQQSEKLQQINAKELEKLSKEELESLSVLKEKLAQNLNILDKKLAKLAENINAVLADFNKTIKVYNMAREKFSESKVKYDNDVKAIEPRKKELEKELDKLAKNIDAGLLEKYKKRRLDNLFPVLVPLNGNCCGGCRMELPFAQISKLKSEGILSCEHCRRLIYFK